MWRRTGGGHRRQAPPRGGRRRHQRPEGGVAPGRGGRRRQDRRRRRHPCPDPPGLLQGTHRPHRPPAWQRPAGGGHDVPAQDRFRRPGTLPLRRRDRDPEVRLLDLWLASGAGGRFRHRREGQRHPAGDRADHDRVEPGCFRAAVRARPLHHPPLHREAGVGRAHHRFLRLFPVLPVGHLQGPVPGRAADRLLSGSAGRALRFLLRHIPSALFHQHLPQLAVGAAVSHAGP